MAPPKDKKDTASIEGIVVSRLRYGRTTGSADTSSKFFAMCEGKHEDNAIVAICYQDVASNLVSRLKSSIADQEKFVSPETLLGGKSRVFEVSGARINVFDTKAHAWKEEGDLYTFNSFSLPQMTAEQSTQRERLLAELAQLDRMIATGTTEMDLDLPPLEDDEHVELPSDAQASTEEGPANEAAQMNEEAENNSVTDEANEASEEAPDSATAAGEEEKAEPDPQEDAPAEDNAEDNSEKEQSFGGEEDKPSDFQEQEIGLNDSVSTSEDAAKPSTGIRRPAGRRPLGAGRPAQPAGKADTASEGQSPKEKAGESPQEEAKTSPAAAPARPLGGGLRRPGASGPGLRRPGL